MTPKLLILTTALIAVVFASVVVISLNTNLSSYQSSPIESAYFEPELIERTYLFVDESAMLTGVVCNKNCYETTWALEDTNIAKEKCCVQRSEEVSFGVAVWKMKYDQRVGIAHIWVDELSQYFKDYGFAVNDNNTWFGINAGSGSSNDVFIDYEGELIINSYLEKDNLYDWVLENYKYSYNIKDSHKKFVESYPEEKELIDFVFKKYGASYND